MDVRSAPLDQTTSTVPATGSRAAAPGNGVSPAACARQSDRQNGAVAAWTAYALPASAATANASRNQARNLNESSVVSTTKTGNRR